MGGSVGAADEGSGSGPPLGDDPAALSEEDVELVFRAVDLDLDAEAFGFGLGLFERFERVEHPETDHVVRRAVAAKLLETQSRYPALVALALRRLSCLHSSAWCRAQQGAIASPACLLGMASGA